jgi:hypothetical protein
MMNPLLSTLAQNIHLSDPAQQALRYRFGLACIERVEHLLEEPKALACLEVFKRFVAGHEDEPHLHAAAAEILLVANGHRGSKSIDGASHAAVSATYAVANALNGRALEAASYAAYATVYAYGGYAVNDPESFEPEFTWQTECLRGLLQVSH